MNAAAACALAVLAVGTAAFAQAPIPAAPPPATPPAAGAPAAPTADAVCDELAGHPLEPGRRGAGVALDRIDVARAVPACEAAVTAATDNGRLWFQWGRALEAAGQDTEAFERYRRAALLGSVGAMTNFGLMLLDGRGIDAADPPAAVVWLRRAAELNYAQAQVAMGALYEEGRGVPQDDAEAVRWYRRAAEAGDATGQNALAWMIEQGRGADADDDEAERLYRRAAEQNLGDALNNLAWFLYTRGREIDEARALATRAFEGASDNPTYADTLAAILIRQGYPGEALALTEFAIGEEPTNAEYQERHGDALWGIERSADARAAWRRALELTQSDSQRRRLQQKLDRP